MDRRTKGAGQIPQDEHIDGPNVKAVSREIEIPGKPISDDIAANAVLVKDYRILRIRVASATFVAFSDDQAALQAATINSSYTASPVIELNTAGTYYIATKGLQWVKASANPARVEAIQD